MRFGSRLVQPLRYWRARTVLLGGLLSLLVAAAGGVPFMWALEEAVDLYLLFQARGARPAPDNVIIVPINGRAQKRLFLPASPAAFEGCTDVRLDPAPPGFRNPDPPEVLTRWPRCLHARALEALIKAEPDTVVIDILFRPRNDPSGVFEVQDKALAAAMHGLRKVILAQKLKSDLQGDEQPEAIARPI